MGLSTEDRLAITELYSKYNHAIDFGDAEGWAATFTADGVFNGGGGGPQQGTEALTGFARGFAANVKGRHWTNNLVVEGEGSSANGKCYLILWNLAQKPASIMATGIYRDELAKTGDGWRFTSRKVDADG
jgi:hypothetical protein